MHFTEGSPECSVYAELAARAESQREQARRSETLFLNATAETRDEAMFRMESEKAKARAAEADVETHVVGCALCSAVTRD